MGNIKAVLFDMDGVLIDAQYWHYEALNKALGLFGVSISRYDHLTTFDGLPTKQKLKILSSVGMIPESLHQLINDLKQKYTMEMISTRCKPVFYHEYALYNLQKMGYRLVVCSNSIRETIHWISATLVTHSLWEITRFAQKTIFLYYMGDFSYSRYIEYSAAV